MIDKWIGVLTKPEETMAAEKANASIVGGIINFAIAALIAGVLLGLLVGLASFAASFIPGAQILGSIGVIAVILVPIIAVILTIICSLIANIFFWIGAKIVGGNGSFGVQYYLLSLMAVPIVIVYIVIMVAMLLVIIPFIGMVIAMIVAGIISGYISIIATMAYISALKQTHSLSTMNVALATGLAVAIIMICYLALIMVVLAPLMMGAASNPFMTGLAGLPF